MSTKPFKADKIIVQTQFHVSGSVTGPFFDDIQNQINNIPTGSNGGNDFDPTEIEGRLDILEEEVPLISSAVDTLSQDLTNLDSFVSSFSGSVSFELSGFETRIGLLESSASLIDISSIEGRLDGLEGNVAVLTSSLDILGGEVLILENSFTQFSVTASNRLDDIEFELDNLELTGSAFDPTEIENRLDGLEQITTETSGGLNSLEQVVSFLQQDVVDIDSSFISFSGSTVTRLNDIEFELDNLELTGSAFDPTEIENRLDVLEGDVSVVTGALDILTETFNAFTGSTENSIFDIETDVDNLIQGAISLENDFTEFSVTASNRLDALEQTALDFSGSLSAVISDTQNLNDAFTFVSGVAAQNVLDISDLQTDLGNVETDVFNLGNDFTNLESDFLAFSGSTEGRLDTLEGDFIGLDSSVTALSGAVEILSDGLSDLTNDFANLSGSFVNLESDFGDLESDFLAFSGSTEGRLDALESAPGGGGTSLQGAYNSGSIIDVGAGFIQVTGSTTTTNPGSRAIEIRTSTNSGCGLVINRTNNSNIGADLVGARTDTTTFSNVAQVSWLIRHQNNFGQFLARSTSDQANGLSFAFANAITMGIGRTSAAAPNNGHLVLQAQNNREIVMRGQTTIPGNWPFRFLVGSSFNATSGRFTSFSPCNFSSSLDVAGEARLAGGVILPLRSVAPSVSGSLAYDAPTGTLGFHDGTQWIKLEGVPY